MLYKAVFTFYCKCHFAKGWDDEIVVWQCSSVVWRSGGLKACMD